jgi:hypothetical protein
MVFSMNFIVQYGSRDPFWISFYEGCKFYVETHFLSVDVQLF